MQASSTNVTETDFTLQQMINATCACDGVFTNSSNVATWGSSVFVALNNTADYFLPPMLFNVPDVPAYKSIYCGPLGAGEGAGMTGWMNCSSYGVLRALNTTTFKLHSWC